MGWPLLLVKYTSNQNSQVDIMQTLKKLISTMPQHGKVDWIGIRPKKRADVVPVNDIEVSVEQGLTGDHYGGRTRKRQVTLIQAEHLVAIAAYLDIDAVRPEQLRRNIVVSGINLLALKKQHVQIGSVTLHMTGPCAPCSRMEEYFGPGGYNAVRGHGGVTAKVLEGGAIAIGDTVGLVSAPAGPD